MASIFSSSSPLPPTTSFLSSRSNGPILKTLTLISPFNSSSSIAQYDSQAIKSIQSCENGRFGSKSSVCFDEQSSPKAKRRDLLLQIFLSAFSFPALASYALAETDVQGDFRTYKDETNKYQILVPQGWLVGAGDTKSIKSVTAFYPEEASDSNVSVVITGLGPDYTSLKSFGTVDAFAETLVSGLDRSWIRPPGVAAKLIDCKSANGLYYVEYTLQNPGEKRRHVFSAIGMASNGWYNRLYTVTGQFVDEELDKYQSKIEKSVSSFRLV